MEQYISRFLLQCFIITFCLRKIEAEWSTWGTWTTCSATCGYGVRTRERTCLDGNCIGAKLRHETCSETNCAGEVTNEWSNWGQWSSCTRTCGGGLKTRVRTCQTGNVSDCCINTVSSSCHLEYTQTRECVNDDCIGSWAGWRDWEACSVSCGEGVQSRHRDCEPENSVCVGGGEQTRACYIQCPTTEEGLVDDAGEAQNCDNNNPCKNGAECHSENGRVTCTCDGNWRGSDCDSLCLYESDTEDCSNKKGLFYDCANCTKFIICSRTGSLISMSCTTDRVWDGNGCSLANETSCKESSKDRK